ncbi:hypothetical protein ABT187_24735 [Streptomyces sp. NPDC001817]|uniref:WXG100 family type VII secretion target n=1 Tax=Streptomyces sp. NPDC001817 TaxID=3154398 RepID=UPI003323BFC5
MGDHHSRPDRYQLERELAQAEIHDTDAQCVPHHGRTDFEKHQLNDMVDMVEFANPEHLEDAGKALWDARDAINDAADELFAHIGRIDWHGEAATAFHTWASSLVTNAYTLGVYVENAGTHVTAACTGLASVRKAVIPLRDTRLMAMNVDDFPLVTRVAGNKDYQAALQVEGHRQEAINQMNRLASYYTVAGQALRDGQAPTFGKMPEMGVPQASVVAVHEGGGDGMAPSGAPAVGSSGRVRHQSVAAPAGPEAGQTPEPVKKLHEVVTAPERHVHTDSPQPVGTDIDSVKTLPPDTVKPTPPVTPPTAPAPGGGGPIPPVPVGPMPPTVRLPVGPSGTGGPRGPIPTTPRLAPRVVGSSRVGGGTGRGPVAPVGRTAVPGEVEPGGPVSPAGKDPVGKAPLGEAPVGRAPAGRNVIGGTSRSVGVPAERMGGTGPTGAARTGGVVGGKPATPPAQSVNGSKLPRGTVIGGEPASRTPRAGERPGQRGVIGAPEQAGGAGQAPRSPVAPTGRAVGTSSGEALKARNDGRLSGVRRGSARGGGKKKSRPQQSPETE